MVKLKSLFEKIKKEKNFEKQKVTEVAKHRGALLSLSDNGCGIHDDELNDKIFDPFFTTKKRASGGLRVWSL